MTMGDFEKAVRAWHEAPFPRGSVVDSLDEAHADLVLYDTWVAESVLPYIERGHWEPAVPDVVAALDALTQDIEARRDTGTEDPEAVSAYLHYAALLRAVYLDFLREGEP